MDMISGLRYQAQRNAAAAAAEAGESADPLGSVCLGSYSNLHRRRSSNLRLGLLGHASQGS